MNTNTIAPPFFVQLSDDCNSYVVKPVPGQIVADVYRRALAYQFAAAPEMLKALQAAANWPAPIAPELLRVINAAIELAAEKNDVAPDLEYSGHYAPRSLDTDYMLTALTLWEAVLDLEKSAAHRASVQSWRAKHQGSAALREHVLTLIPKLEKAWAIAQETGFTDGFDFEFCPAFVVCILENENASAEEIARRIVEEVNY